MDSSDKVTFKVKEGAAEHYFEALYNTFGGEFTENSYDLNRGRTNIRFYNFQVMPGFDIMVNSAIHYQAVEMIREPDNDPDYFHFNLIREGRPEQNIIDQKEFMEAGNSSGVFINNGLFPMRSNFPANVMFRSLAFKVTKDAFQRILPEAWEIMKTLFEDNIPVFYHSHLPAELASLMDDIFHFKKSEFGSNLLVISRGLELFTLLMKSLRKLVNRDELHGLHIDDYNRLLKLKDQLLSSFDQRISVEELASEFGISVSKLKRDFKTLFNTSVYQFYTHAKMDEAYRRLKTGKFSVMEVGYDLGYQNLSKFSQMFKKVKGINPKDVLPV